MNEPKDQRIRQLEAERDQLKERVEGLTKAGDNLAHLVAVQLGQMDPPQRAADRVVFAWREAVRER
jgi:hypothetical protein